MGDPLAPCERHSSSPCKDTKQLVQQQKPDFPGERGLLMFARAQEPLGAARSGQEGGEGAQPPSRAQMPFRTFLGRKSRERGWRGEKKRGQERKEDKMDTQRKAHRETHTWTETEMER